MAPLVVRPVASTYDPGYPRFTEICDWSSLLEPGRTSLLRPAALFAGLLGSCLFVADGRAADAPEAKPKPPLQSSNARADSIANAALAEVRSTGHWFARSGADMVQVVPGQPAITVPVIRVSFGNSYVGIFDVARAQKATIEMFAAYGVKLVPKHHFQRDGIEFEADGYDPVSKVGFEILGVDDPDPSARTKAAPRPAGEVLDAGETSILKDHVVAGSESFFLAEASSYPNMDGDQYTPLRAYLKSALDYLDWLKKQGRLK
jgi:hypothetical protein